jgi:hypothetical protein
MSKKRVSNRQPGPTHGTRSPRRTGDERQRQPSKEATPDRDAVREAKTTAGGKAVAREEVVEPGLDSLSAAKRLPPPEDQPL